MMPSPEPPTRCRSERLGHLCRGLWQPSARSLEEPNRHPRATLV